MSTMCYYRDVHYLGCDHTLNQKWGRCGKFPRSSCQKDTTTYGSTTKSGLCRECQDGEWDRRASGTASASSSKPPPQHQAERPPSYSKLYPSTAQHETRHAVAGPSQHTELPQIIVSEYESGSRTPHAQHQSQIRNEPTRYDPGTSRSNSSHIQGETSSGNGIERAGQSDGQSPRGPGWNTSTSSGRLGGRSGTPASTGESTSGDNLGPSGETSSTKQAGNLSKGLWPWGNLDGKGKEN